MASSDFSSAGFSAAAAAISASDGPTGRSIAASASIIPAGASSVAVSSALRRRAPGKGTPSGAGVLDAYVNDAGALWTGFSPVTQDALSVYDFELANDIKIILTTNGLEVLASNSVQLQRYSVYSISGAKVKTGRESIITTNTLSHGIYVLKLEFDKGIVTKKVLID